MSKGWSCALSTMYVQIRERQAFLDMPVGGK
jgi:hypothetical protein